MAIILAIHSANICDIVGLCLLSVTKCLENYINVALSLKHGIVSNEVNFKNAKHLLINYT